MRPVNLLPANLRPRERSGKAGGAYATLGILGVLLVATVGYVLLANQVTARQAETERLRVETQEAEARAGALGSFGDFRQMKEVRVSSVRQLSAVRFDWERTSRELARLLPQGVWLSELQATATGESAGGASSSSSSSSSSASASSSPSSSAGSSSQAAGPNLRLVGCAPSQQAVAETMVRLRRLHQAADVTLVNSEQPQDQGSPASGGASGAAATTGPTAAGAGATGATEGCGERKGRANYKFEVGVTLTPVSDSTVDGRSVPRSLGGGA